MDNPKEVVMLSECIHPLSFTRFFLAGSWWGGVTLQGAGHEFITGQNRMQRFANTGNSHLTHDEI